MKRFNKILAIFLALLMLLSVLVACKQDKEGDDTSEESSEETTEEPKKDITKIINQEQFDALVKSLSENPEQSKGKSYKLFVDVSYANGWDPTSTTKYGKLQTPEEIPAFAGIKEFYGEFDGNGKKITAIYRVNEDTGATAVGGFIDKLNGGTVKNLTIETAFVFDKTASGASVGGFVGVVNGEGAVLENITVNSNVYAANDGAVSVGGVVGSVEAGNFTMNKVTFGGKVGNVGSNLSVDNASAQAVIGQLIGNASDKSVTLTDCAANGDIICNASATKDAYVGAGSAVTNNNPTTTPPEVTGLAEATVYEISTAAELLDAGAYNSNYEGKTIVLKDNINLNEAWVAGTGVPTTVWSGFAEFKGTFDGNGKSISGLYVNSANNGNVGFINVLNGGTVKNLAVMNGEIAYTAEAASNVGLIGTVNGGTVDTVYTVLSITVNGDAEANVGGIAGKTEGAAKVSNILFNGSISAEGKTVDAVVASQSAESAISEVLCVGDYALATEGRTNVFKGIQATAPEGTDWEVTKYPAETYVPKSIATLMKSFAAIEADISWYDPALTEFTISTPEQLLGLSVLAQNVYGEDGDDEDTDPDLITAGETFEGKTIKIGADIDLNPNWDATTNVSSANIVTVCGAPLNRWVSIPLFKGKIDGQGHTISGLYSATEFDAPVDNYRYLGGFINELVGGEIRNLIVDNSHAYFTSPSDYGSSKIRLAGFISRVADSTLDTLYVDMDAWLEFKHRYNMAGMILEFDTANTDTGAYVGTVKNLVYAGSSGRIITDGDGNKSCKVDTAVDGRICVSGMLGVNLYDEDDVGNKVVYDINLMIENVSMIGEMYTPFVSAGGFDNDVVLGYSGTANKYSHGISVNNATIYIGKVFAMNYKQAVTNGEAERNFNTNKEMGDTGVDYKNVNSTAPGDDKYTEENWAYKVIDTGSGADTNALLPKTVVDMLNAANA